MRRILLHVAYDGTAYSGFQRQKDLTIPTVEGRIAEALLSLTGAEPELIGGSRTDAGVHAYDNVTVFDTESRIPADRFARALNTRLPEDIRAWKSEEVEADFHPRHRKTVKTYVYRIWNAQIPDPMQRLYTHHSFTRFDVGRMQEAAAYLVGEHDFKSFCNVHTQALTTVRKVLSVEVSASFEEMPRTISIEVKGEGFLYNMVRIIAGTLMEVGAGQYPPERVREILEGCDRTLAGHTAEAKGLTLVRYEMFEEDERNRQPDGTGEEPGPEPASMPEKRPENPEKSD